MGRRKIQIAPIVDDRNRSVTFLKRKNGLMKKAYELGILCGADVAVIVFSGNGKLYEFSSGDLNSTLLRYSKHDGPPHEHRGPGDYDGTKQKGAASGSRAPVAAGAADDDDDDDDEGGDEASDGANRPSGEEGKGKAPLHPGPTWTYTTSGSINPSTSAAHGHSPAAFAAAGQPPPMMPNPYGMPPYDPAMYQYGFPGMPRPPGGSSMPTMPGMPGHAPPGAGLPPGPIYAAAYNAITQRMGGAGPNPGQLPGFPPFHPAFAFGAPGFPPSIPTAQPTSASQTPLLAAAAAAAAAAEAYYGQAHRTRQPNPPAPTRSRSLASGLPSASQSSAAGSGSGSKYNFATLAAAAMGKLDANAASTGPQASGPSTTTKRSWKEQEGDAVANEDGAGASRRRPKPRHDTSLPNTHLAGPPSDAPVRSSSVAPTLTVLSSGGGGNGGSGSGTGPEAADRDSPVTTTTAGAPSTSAEEHLQALRDFLPGFGGFDMASGPPAHEAQAAPSTRRSSGVDPGGISRAASQGAVDAPMEGEGTFTWPTVEG